ncbi:hypothetical protein Q5752_001629 [Cryptotrichosporon argae]
MYFDKPLWKNHRFDRVCIHVADYTDGPRARQLVVVVLDPDKLRIARPTKPWSPAVVCVEYVASALGIAEVYPSTKWAHVDDLVGGTPRLVVVNPLLRSWRARAAAEQRQAPTQTVQKALAKLQGLVRALLVARLQRLEREAGVVTGRAAAAALRYLEERVEWVVPGGPGYTGSCPVCGDVLKSNLRPCVIVAYA